MHTTLNRGLRWSVCLFKKEQLIISVYSCHLVYNTVVASRKMRPKILLGHMLFYFQPAIVSVFEVLSKVFYSAWQKSFKVFLLDDYFLH